MNRPDVLLLGCAALLALGCADDRTVEIPLTPLQDQLGWEAVPLSQIPQQIEEGDYRVRSEDRLEISVYQDPELNRVVPVRPDGKISFPLIGELAVAGRTVEEVRSLLSVKLSRLLRQPEVSVIVQEFAGIKVLVLGEVGTPGEKSVRRNSRVLDALAAANGIKTSQSSLAGGGEQGPDLARAYFLRDERVLAVDFERLIERADSRQNILLREGDVIYVPSTLDNEIYVLGEVQTPKTIRFRNRISLVEALAEAGGPVENVTTGTIVVVRDSLRDPGAYAVSLDDIVGGNARNIPLQRGDIVYVSPSVLDSLVDVSSKVQKLLELLLTGRQAKAAATTFDQSDR